MTHRIPLVLLTFACTLFVGATAHAQQPGNGQGGQNGGQVSGIRIDAEGVVTPVFVGRQTQLLSAKRREAAARSELSADVNRPSDLRKVSLPQLEAAYKEYAERDEAPPAEMQFLAGLQRIDYLFVFPETNDIVIAGPAEGFATDPAGRAVGVTTGRPPLRLDDLIVALRALEQGGEIGCSIDPQPENLAAVNQFVARNSSPATPSVIEGRFARMAKILGMQDVRVFGVPAETHFAEVLVEADYRMKLTSVGLERPPVRGFRSHLDMIQPGGNSLQRWWLAPLYDPFETNDERTAYRFTGQRVQLMSQDEFLGPGGKRSDAPFTRVTTQAFAKLFTEKYPELADTVPIFAELQNLFDLAVLAALLKRERLPEQAGWMMDQFVDPERAKVPEGNPPRTVATVVNYRKANRGLIVGLIGGGVTLDPVETLRSLKFEVNAENRLDGIRTAAGPPEAHLWWWD